MFNYLFFLFLFLLQPTNCIYIEVRGKAEANKSLHFVSAVIEPGKYYWFEVAENIYLVYFDINSKLHKNPFILIMAVPRAKKTQWPFLENERVLVDAFDDFDRTSTFISLLPNKQNNIHYSIMLEFEDAEIHTDVELGTTIVLKGYGFCLEKVIDSVPLLEHAQIGTKTWSIFYQEGDHYYALFAEVYYVAYKETVERPNALTSFRTAELIEVTVIKFQTNTEHGQLFLSNESRFFEIDTNKNANMYFKNSYSFLVSFPFSVCGLIFPVEADKTQQILFFFAKTKLSKQAKRPAIEKLTQTGASVYFLEKNSEKAIELEVPVYFFGQSREVSRLVVLFRFVLVKQNNVVEVYTFFRTYDFAKKENVFYFQVVEDCWLFFDHFIENGKVFFKLTKMVKLKEKDSVFVPAEVGETCDVIEKDNVSAFLNGAIIYDPQSVVLLTSSVSYAKMDKRTSDLKNGSKSLGQKYKIGSLCLLLLFLFFAGLFFVRRFRKKLAKKKKRFGKI